MELSGIGNLDTLLTQAVGRGESAALDRQAAGLAAGEGDLRDLRAAAKQFEGVFLNTLLKAMRKTVPANELFNSQGATKFYREMHDAELAKAMAESGSGMGIADLIVQQFGGARSTAPTTAPPAAGRVPLGPPSPQAALERYRDQSGVADRTGRMVGLRRLAERQEPAVSDTLRRYEAPLAAASRGSGVDPGLLLAVVLEESGGDAAAVSPKGAVGLMQLMPGTARELGVEDATRPAENLAGGARYLAGLLERYEGRLDLALAAYNAGPGRVDAAGGTVPGIAETERYVRRVLERFERLGGGTKLAIVSP